MSSPTKLNASFSILAVLALCSVAAQATELSYTATNIIGNQWRYDYTLANNTLSNPIDEFTIYFDLGQYGNLTSPAQPAGWNSVIAQSDVFLPAPGFFDSAANLTGLLPGGTLGGFSVEFDWLGVGSPGAQSFDIIDSTTFAALESGTTTAATPVVAVPEPGPFALLLAGFAAIGLVRWRSAHSEKTAARGVAL